MLAKGRQSLTDSELLAIILGSGSQGESAVDLSKRILADYKNNLNELGKISIGDLIKNYKGVGEAKAINIIAALELGRRRQASDILERDTIKSSADAFKILYPLVGDLPHEEFWIILLNRANKVIKTIFIGKGGISHVIADIKIIMRHALENMSSQIILCHNHPSGNLNPSKEDFTLTEKLTQAAKLFDITITDHIIVCDNRYVSFRDESLLK
jgi:DNA repair protein RadC